MNKFKFTLIGVEHDGLAVKTNKYYIELDDPDFLQAYIWNNIKSGETIKFIFWGWVQEVG